MRDANEHIVIGNDRSVKVPDSVKVIAVQYDHNVNVVTFDCPRYSDEIDLSGMQVYINYMLPNKEIGCSLAQNVTVDENDNTIMHFEWVITRNVTIVSGPLSCLVCIKQTDSEGKELYHWNSELFQKLVVSNGMECGEVIVDENPDIIASILAKIKLIELDNASIHDDILDLQQGQGSGESGSSTTNLVLRGILQDTAVSYTLESHYYYSVDEETNTAVKNPYDTYSCCELSVSPGELYLITLRERSVNVDYIIAVDDANNVIDSALHGTTSTVQRTDYEFVVPTGATKLYISTFYPESEDQFGIKKKEVKSNTDFYNALASIEQLDTKIQNVSNEVNKNSEAIEKVDSHILATMNKVGVVYTHTKKLYMYVDKTTGALSSGTADTYYSCKLNVKEGEIYSITLQERSTLVDYIIATDDSDNVLDSQLHGTTSTVQRTDYLYTIPKGATKLYLSTFYPESFSHFHVYKYVQNRASVVYGEGSINNIPLSWSIGNIPTNGIEYFTGDNSRIKNNEFVKFDGEIGIIEPPTGCEVNVIYFGENYELKGYSGFNSSTYIFDTTQYPYYRFTQKKTDGTSFTDASVGMPYVKCFTQIKKFKGLKFSVLGDSISSFDRSGSHNEFADGSDILPSGNKIYYDGTNAGITDISQMWWSKVSLMLGLDRLVINAWSGSKISNIDAEVSNFTPMSDTARCQGLHTDSSDPDVIFFWGGTNDFSKANANIGSWNGGAYPNNASDFSSAYALALRRMQERYPNADIYCFSLATIVRTKTVENGAEISSDNKSVADYNAVIKKMCDIFGTQYVDLSHIGFTRANSYPDYVEDSSTVPTHPNDKGMTLYAERIVREIASHTF